MRGVSAKTPQNVNGVLEEIKRDKGIDESPENVTGVLGETLRNVTGVSGNPPQNVTGILVKTNQM